MRDDPRFAPGTRCNHESVTVKREYSLLDAAGLMRDHHVGCVVVVERTAGGGHRPIGADRALRPQSVAMSLIPWVITLGLVVYLVQLPTRPR
jgi:CBS domain-containing protein